MKGVVSLTILATTAAAFEQVVLGQVDRGSEWTVFPHPIKRVAVIGAGPSGLQVAAELLEHNFTVRLFDRSPGPGGNWLYSEEYPTRESYPDTRLEDIIKPWVPGSLPHREYYLEGDDGLTLDYRWREHWQPSPVWWGLHTNSPTSITEMPDVPYPPDSPFAPHQKVVSSHVRAYATLHGLNVNDEPTVAYSTLVERIDKAGETWNLTLKRVKKIENVDLRTGAKQAALEAEWWQESFDAVVVSQGLEDGSEIARELEPYAKHIYVSSKDYDRSKLHPFRRRAFRRLPSACSVVAEVAEFRSLGNALNGIKDGKVVLKDGETLTGIDEVNIKLTYGCRSQLINASTRESDGRRRYRNVHWTGNYIPDPTLAFTNTRPWTTVRYQAYGLAKIWEGTARLPNEAELWRQYESARYTFFWDLWGTGRSEALLRQWVAWLNNESLQHGGRLVNHFPNSNREIFSYFMNWEIKEDYISYANFTDFEHVPAWQWGQDDLADALWHEDELEYGLW
ncbi:hypothetical protein K488DRAFT_72817 [Vararia minispora EC-137]|uniref:Uncharacterized protein n=1 Tax=Vararia minispora EC-137 TaxID=1314806 RepID=A0ACB8QDF2_9AGAM|nr:hypothetical protein K488DRAFT_72817 [Vararia minispora EC-137]